MRHQFYILLSIIFFWSVSGHVVANTTCEEHNPTILSVDLLSFQAFDISDNQLAIGRMNTLYFIDYQIQEIIREENFAIFEAIQLIKFNPNGTQYVILYKTGQDNEIDTIKFVLEIRDSATHIPISTILLSYQNSQPSVSWSPDGQSIALVGKMSGVAGQTVRVWDVDSLEVTHTYEGNWILEPHTELSAWSPDGNVFAYADNLDILLWDTADWSLINTIQFPFPTYREQIQSLGWANDGDIVIGAGIVYILHVPSGSLNASWAKEHQGIRTVEVSPNLRWVAQGGRWVNQELTREFGGISIRNYETQGIVYEFDVHETPVFDVEWTDDSQTVFSVSADSIYQWDIETGCTILEIRVEEN